MKLQYGMSIGRALQTDATADVEAALNRQRVFWKAAAITVIVGFGFAILMIVFMSVIAAGMATSGWGTPR